MSRSIKPEFPNQPDKMLNVPTSAQDTPVAEAARRGFNEIYAGRYVEYLDPDKVDKGKDGKRCPYFVKSLQSGCNEQCALQVGHEGIHKWAGGD